MSSLAGDDTRSAPFPPTAISTTVKDECDTAEVSNDEEVSYPEGGLQAWLVVFGSFCGMYLITHTHTLPIAVPKTDQRSRLACYGYMNSISTYNTYLSAHQLEQYSASSIAWIFSTYIFLTFLCGIFIGPIFDARGPRALVAAGGGLMMASIMLMGICTGE